MHTDLPCLVDIMCTCALLMVFHTALGVVNASAMKASHHQVLSLLSG